MKCKICNSDLVPWYKDLFDDRHGYPGKFKVKRCISCGFGQTFPQLQKNKIAQIYSKYYPWHKLDIKNIKEADYKMPDKAVLWRKGLLFNGQYLVKRKSKVLDVGCGLGFSLLELKSIGCKAYGVDPDKNAIKLSKKFGLKFKVGFIDQNPFPKDKFDYIIANQVLEHTNDPIDFLVKCKSKLNKNGKIIMSFPNSDALSLKLFKRNWLHWHIPFHLNFFSKKSIKTLAEKTELEIISLKTVTPNMWTNLQIRRLLQKPVPGKRDTFWDGKTSDNPGLLKIGYITKIVRFLEEYNLLNRLIDLAGVGDSFVVTFKASR